MEASLFDKYENVKSYVSDTLFPLDFSSVRDMKCPKCGNKLRVMRNGGVICTGVKHAKAFVLTRKQFNEINAKA